MQDETLRKMIAFISEHEEWLRRLTFYKTAGVLTSIRLRHEARLQASEFEQARARKAAADAEAPLLAPKARRVA